ncbi:DarT ssDNA thymidine ADP-ribosyltransferase family protein [Pseudonocardia lacus]|uniref:DarT ssDNA thymidine ADP-ribosyltransferase family protein n=1 Tax=Pseudonocardia lacus TaxID=2835865 RepID=UPI001BDCA62F|nr:DarT ssDNA thymidine ADP-ribosyltransferase family protein [Pseudonocardia lacus]
MASLTPSATAASGFGCLVFFPMMFAAGVWTPGDTVPERYTRIVFGYDHHVRPPPTNRLIMHFTHVDNLSSILAGGEILADCLVRSSSSTRVRECADPSIKQSRRDIDVRVAPGGKVGQ